MSKYAVAQIGFKSGKDESIAKLLTTSELPDGNWLTDRTVASRATSITKADEIVQRAREKRLIFATRSFRRDTDNFRIYNLICPLVSVEDAESYVSSFEERLVRSTPNWGNLTEIHVVQDLAPSDFETVNGIERRVSNQKIKDRNFKDIAGHVHNDVYIISCSGPDDGWIWSDVVAIAALQNSKLRSR